MGALGLGEKGSPVRGGGSGWSGGGCRCLGLGGRG